MRVSCGHYRPARGRARRRGRVACATRPRQGTHYWSSRPARRPYRNRKAVLVLAAHAHRVDGAVAVDVVRVGARRRVSLPVPAAPRTWAAEACRCVDLMSAATPATCGGAIGVARGRTAPRQRRQRSSPLVAGGAGVCTRCCRRPAPRCRRRFLAPVREYDALMPAGAGRQRLVTTPGSCDGMSKQSLVLIVRVTGFVSSGDESSTIWSCARSVSALPAAATFTAPFALGVLRGPGDGRDSAFWSASVLQLNSPRVGVVAGVGDVHAVVGRPHEATRPRPPWLAHAGWPARTFRLATFTPGATPTPTPFFSRRRWCPPRACRGRTRPPPDATRRPCTGTPPRQLADACRSSSARCPGGCRRRRVQRRQSRRATAATSRWARSAFDGGRSHRNGSSGSCAARRRGGASPPRRRSAPSPWRCRRWTARQRRRSRVAPADSTPCAVRSSCEVRSRVDDEDADLVVCRDDDGAAGLADRLPDPGRIAPARNGR